MFQYPVNYNPTLIAMFPYPVHNSPSLIAMFQYTVHYSPSLIAILGEKGTIPTVTKQRVRKIVCKKKVLVM
jgi:hypothetical protein